MAAHLHTDEPHVRQAFERLESEGRAKIVRRGRGLHLVPADYAGKICPVCRAEMRKRQHGKTCSKSCGMKVAWTKRDRDRQGEVLRATRRRQPETFKTFASLRNNPEHRRFVAERNRQDWADPEKKMRRVIAMEQAWHGDAAAMRRDRARQQAEGFWSDPRKKASAVEAMRTGRRGRFKRAAIEMTARGLAAEDIATATGRTINQTRQLLRRLYKDGLIATKPADGRKRRPVRRRASSPDSSTRR